MCYVGKATKIFLCLVALLGVIGLILGFGLAHHTWGGRRAGPCRSPDCRPVYADPLPADATTAPNPMASPAISAFPGVASPVAPAVASSTALPPVVPGFSPPSPMSVGLGPAHA